MFAAMAILLSSIASRLRLRCRNKRITSSSVNPRPPFFSCGGGGGDALSPFVKPKTTRKLKAPSSKRFTEHDQDGRTVDDDDVHEPCLWRWAAASACTDSAPEPRPFFGIRMH
ncbi:hypothetical protein CFC21_035574 [Triticum aestivum]|uniref:Uncharacterized protein n=2 Tax=Triticum aestivum TaxID=4565 RepID=A0A3B6EGB1_WHEAT|nr:hypothetical protein CFC21_035574 [Triticum aestivum]